MTVTVLTARCWDDFYDNRHNNDRDQDQEQEQKEG